MIHDAPTCELSGISLAEWIVTRKDYAVGRTSREETEMDLAIVIPVVTIPLLAAIICLVVTWIWGD